jgi:hypothetical protein
VHRDTLVGGGGPEHGGFDVLDHRKIKHGDAGNLDHYSIQAAAVLPDKFARFMYEFHDFRFESLDRPPLPADRGSCAWSAWNFAGNAQVPKMLISIIVRVD